MRLKLTRIQEIKDIILSQAGDDQIRQALEKYHGSDIADAMQQLEERDRKKVYGLFDEEWVSEIFTYLDNVSIYIEELEPEQALRLIKNMDADDALDVLEDMEDSGYKSRLLAMMDETSFADIRFIASFPENEIGHMMTTNYVTVREGETVKEAMRSVIRQAQENDNVNTIFVLDKNGHYGGAIELKDLIIAREYTKLDEIITKNYPSINATDKVSEVIEQLKEYAEDSIPVLNGERRVVGIITSDDIVEAVDREMGDDYAKLAGLTSEEDLNETLKDSMKKRLPWLILLLGLGMVVSAVVGIFEAIVAQVAVVVCFQSLILDMAGNVGTQSLAVTIRVLMDEEISGKTKMKFIGKEIRVGGTNGLLLGTLSFVCVGFYLHWMKGMAFREGFLVSGCVGMALFLAMIISSLVGTVIPMFFHKIKVDPAVASGPLITTINDLVAVVTYYGLAGVLLTGLHLAA